jgi:hypothetical protein
MTLLATDNRWVKAASEGDFGSLFYGMVLTRLQMGASQTMTPAKGPKINTKCSSTARFIPSRFEKNKPNDIISLQSDPNEAMVSNNTLLEDRAFNPFNVSRSEAKKLPAHNPNVWTEQEFDEQIRKLEKGYEKDASRNNMTSIGSNTIENMNTIQPESTRDVPKVQGIMRAGTADVKYRGGKKP